MSEHRVVIVGGGFGGLYAAQRLRKAAVRITLIDRRNFHLFQPLLYQVATGSLSPANIAAPLRAVLRRQRNVNVLMGEVTDFDLDRREVIAGERRTGYDSLIVAAGARHHYFGHPQWERDAPGLKTLEDATTMRRRILSAFERAELEDDPARREALLTFVVVGGGPTGVELAGAVGEMARHTLRGNFRRIDPASARVLLLEAGGRILTAYPEKLSVRAARDLTRIGATVWLNAAVTGVEPGVVRIKREGVEQAIACHTVLWGAGVAASPLAALLAARSGARTDRAGRVLVRDDCTLPNRPEVFALGDMAAFLHQTGQPLPGVAQVAMQMGNYAADTIRRRVEARPALGPFRYNDRGNMATIGRNAAVVDAGWMKLTGLLGWLAWLFVHILYLIRFENRVLVMWQWAWSYFTRGRAARLITTEWEPLVPGADAGERPPGSQP